MAVSTPGDVRAPNRRKACFFTYDRIAPFLMLKSSATGYWNVDERNGTSHVCFKEEEEKSMLSETHPAGMLPKQVPVSHSKCSWRLALL